MTPRKEKNADYGYAVQAHRRRVWAPEEYENHRGGDADSMQSLTPNSFHGHHALAVRNTNAIFCKLRG